MRHEDQPDLPGFRPCPASTSPSPEKPKWWSVSRFIKTAGCFAVVGIVWPYAWELSDVKPNIIHACLLWLVVFGSLAAAFWVWATLLRKLYRFATIVVSLGIVVFVFKDKVIEQYHIQNTVEKPSVKLAIFRTSVDLYAGVELTNDFLIASSNSTILEEDAGYVVVPVPLDATNVAVSFGVDNNSSVIIQNGAARVGVPLGDTLGVGQGWFDSVNPEDKDSIRLGLKRIVYRIPDLSPGDGQSFPAIMFKPDSSRHYPLTVAVKANDMEMQFWMFWITFIRMNDEGLRGTKIQIVRGVKQPDGKIMIPIEFRVPSTNDPLFQTSNTNMATFRTGQ